MSSDSGEKRRRRVRPDPYEDNEAEAKFSLRGWWKGGLAFLSLLLFVGLLWYAYQSGGDGAYGPVRTVEADPTPFKEKPEDPGGLQVPDQDKLVFKEAVGRAPDGAETLAPPPETPVARPEPVVADVQMPEPTAPVPQTGPALAEKPAPPPDPPAPVAEKSIEEDKPAAPTEAAQPAADAPLSTPPGAGVETTSQATREAVDVPQPLAPNASGTFVQLGSFKELDAAKAEWRRVRGRYPDILVSPNAHVKRADIPGKGIYQRLMVGPYASRAEAETVCNLLKSRGQDCFIFIP